MNSFVLGSHSTNITGYRTGCENYDKRENRNKGKLAGTGHMSHSPKFSKITISNIKITWQINDSKEVL